MKAELNKSVKLYRKRYIPDELICLEEDELIFMDEEVIVTKWKVLKPRCDFMYGSSCYYLKKGFKVSRIYDQNLKLLYHYCDIVRCREDGNSLIFEDLLADVVVYNDGFVKVLDIGEIASALNDGLITAEHAKEALVRLDELLDIIYTGRFPDLTGILNTYSC